MSKINSNSHFSMPKPFPLNVTKRDIKIAEAIINKGKASWDDVAKKLNMSRRRFFDYRHRPEVKQVVGLMSFSLIETEIPEILTVLLAKSKKGDIAAIKLLLETANISSFFETRLNNHRKFFEEYIAGMTKMLMQVAPERRNEYLQTLSEMEKNKYDVLGG